jgi:hypothetical protein
MDRAAGSTLQKNSGAGFGPRFCFERRQCDDTQNTIFLPQLVAP